ncbi:MAG: oxidoreductase, partial [Alphaproteobacteria bacterium]|nr:oxidoreductase [Alphaproteobacteria bacterium]
MPYGKALAAAANPALAGKIVVDMSNPITPDFADLLLGFDTSAAETIQAAVPQARVVKAYNTIFSALLDQPLDQTQTVPVFLAGNDAAAVTAVAELVTLSGFAAEQTGGLETSRLLEPLGLLNIKFGYGLGQGTAIAPTWVRLSA